LAFGWIAAVGFCALFTGNLQILAGTVHQYPDRGGSALHALSPVEDGGILAIQLLDIG
jgi:hypothetical protein